MKGYIEERVLELANFIIDKKTTVRAAAKKFGISKSTVHMDVAKWRGELIPNLRAVKRLTIPKPMKVVGRESMSTGRKLL